MRIGCLQFAPQVGDVDNNLNRADAVLSKANPEDLDILVLPEMAFSGMTAPFCLCSLFFEIMWSFIMSSPHPCACAERNKY